MAGEQTAEEKTRLLALRRSSRLDSAQCQRVFTFICNVFSTTANRSQLFGVALSNFCRHRTVVVAPLKVKLRLEKGNSTLLFWCVVELATRVQLELSAIAGSRALGWPHLESFCTCSTRNYSLASPYANLRVKRPHPDSNQHLAPRPLWPINRN